MAGVYGHSDVCLETCLLQIYYKNILCSTKTCKSDALQYGLLGGRDARTSAECQAAASPRWSALAGARAAKRESRVRARGRSSSHATRRSILIAAAMATCCTWVFARPQYLVRRRPKARTPCESVPSTPARRLYSCCPSSLADHVCAAASASYWSWGGSRSRRPVCLARVQQGRTGHVSQVCLSNATMMGQLPCPPPCSHHATDRCPWGQRTCCWSQSTANWSIVYAPSPWVCQPWRGRVGPRRMMPCSSRLWTSNSELI